MRTLPACLLAVSLLHSALLAAVLHAGVAPLPAEPAPMPVTIELVPPAPPAVSAPLPEPEPAPQPAPQPKPRPIEQQPKPAPQPEPVSNLFADAPASAPVETAPSTAAVSDAPPAPSEPRFDADYLQNPAPVYPALSRKRGEHGVVLLRVHVRADGSADQIEFVESSGYSRLDDAAMRAVKRWRFVPAKRGEETVAAWVRVPVRFDLQR
ncbi:MAG TPA: energy transducer TonB [Permianibacter sp.]|nr:energy transducer TonB [Permianibacter sp.]